MKEHGREEFLFEEQAKRFERELRDRGIAFTVDYGPIYFGDVMEGETTYGWVFHW